MESISVFDILKIGIGPSSSHTLGPWRAVQQCLNEFYNGNPLQSIRSIEVYLYGSLAKTGPGHGTNKAIMLGIMGFDPETIDCEKIEAYVNEIKASHKITIYGKHEIAFHPQEHIHFKTQEQLPFHSNALKVISTACKFFSFRKALTASKRTCGCLSWIIFANSPACKAGFERRPSIRTAAARA